MEKQIIEEVSVELLTAAVKNTFGDEAFLKSNVNNSYKALVSPDGKQVVLKLTCEVGDIIKERSCPEKLKYDIDKQPNRYYIDFDTKTQDGKDGKTSINLPKEFKPDKQVREFYLYAYSAPEDKTKGKDGSAFTTVKGSTGLRAMVAEVGADKAPSYNSKLFSNNRDFVAWTELKKGAKIA
jgi:hypothetical protein